MKFDEFWNKLCKKTSGGVQFTTIARKLSFTATYDGGKIIIQPSEAGRDERPLSRNEFHKVWLIAQKLSKSEVYLRKNYNESFHGSYIIAMMKEILIDKDIEN